MPKTILKQGRRFWLMLGKFGTYFYDKRDGKDLSNEDVLGLLEAGDGGE